MNISIGYIRKSSILCTNFASGFRKKIVMIKTNSVKAWFLAARPKTLYYVSYSHS